MLEEEEKKEQQKKTEEPVFPTDAQVEMKDREESLTKEQYRELSETLTSMAEQAILDQNREQLEELKQDREKFLLEVC